MNEYHRTVESDLFLNGCPVSRAFLARVTASLSNSTIPQRCAFRTSKEARRKASIRNGTPSRERICRASRDPQVQHAAHNTARVARARPTSLHIMWRLRRHRNPFLHHGVSRGSYLCQHVDAWRASRGPERVVCLPHFSDSA